MTEEAREHLSRLAAELEKRGWTVSFTSSANPTLSVCNPHAPGISDRVRCASGDNELFFVWDRGPVIGPVSDIETAADHIQHILRAVVEETQ